MKEPGVFLLFERVDLNDTTGGVYIMETNDDFNRSLNTNRRRDTFSQVERRKNGKTGEGETNRSCWWKGGVISLDSRHGKGGRICWGGVGGGGGLWLGVGGWWGGWGVGGGGGCWVDGKRDETFPCRPSWGQNRVVTFRTGHDQFFKLHA